MEKIILVNPVETSSQPSSSDILLDGKVVKIAITDGPQVLFCQVVLAKVGERGKRKGYEKKCIYRLLPEVCCRRAHLREVSLVSGTNLCAIALNNDPRCKPNFIA